MDELTRAAGERRARTLASPRWQGGAFRNTHARSAGLAPGSRLAVARELAFGGAPRRPPGPLPSVDPRPAWARPVARGLRATWLGHSTVLLELDGVRVLTDPVWSDHISPVSWLGPRRFQPVPVPIAALPPLDAIVISHDHFDHLDAPTVRALAPRGVPMVTPLGVGAHLAAWGVPPAQIVELDWWEAATLRGGDLRITAAPAQHFSGRVGPRDRTLWASMVIETAHRRVFFSGDTGPTPEHAEIGARLGPFELALLEVGAYHPAWGHVHLGPDKALAATRLLGGARLLPVHWGTFNLALHGWDEPAEALLARGPGAGVALVMPRLGEAVEPARVETAAPWWRAAGGAGG